MAGAPIHVAEYRDQQPRYCAASIASASLDLTFLFTRDDRGALYLALIGPSAAQWHSPIKMEIGAGLTGFRHWTLEAQSSRDRLQLLVGTNFNSARFWSDLAAGQLLTLDDGARAAAFVLQGVAEALSLFDQCSAAVQKEAH
jgi:hypothetical protein